MSLTHRNALGHGVQSIFVFTFLLGILRVHSSASRRDWEDALAVEVEDTPSSSGPPKSIRAAILEAVEALELS